MQLLIVILDYIGKISSKTIAEDFLENTVGPLVLKLADFNNDNLKDIYILNNGRQNQSKFYLSPEHKNAESEAKKQEGLLKDVAFYKNKNKIIRVDLLQNNQVFIEDWEKKFNID